MNIEDIKLIDNIEKIKNLLKFYDDYIEKTEDIILIQYALSEQLDYINPTYEDTFCDIW